MQGDGRWETEEEERNVTLECSLWVSAWATEERESTPVTFLMPTSDSSKLPEGFYPGPSASWGQRRMGGNETKTGSISDEGAADKGCSAWI